MILHLGNAKIYNWEPTFINMLGAIPGIFVNFWIHLIMFIISKCNISFYINCCVYR